MTRHVNATTIGPTAASYVSLALLKSDIVLENITYTLTSTELEVDAFALVFDELVDITFYFFLVGSDLETAIQLKTSNTFGKVYQQYLHTYPPEPVATMQGTDTLVLSFSSSATSPLNVPKGLTFAGNAVVTNGTLFNALRWFSWKSTSFQTAALMFIPVFSTPEDVSLTVSAGPFALSKTLSAPKVTLEVDLPTQINLNVPLVATVQAGSPNAQVLDFSLTGQYLIQNEKLSLNGDLTNTWAHPFDLKWLDLSSAKGTLVLANDGTQGLTLTAIGTLSFASGPVTADVSFTGANYDNILLEVTNIPISKTLQNLYTDITGKTANALGQVTVSGTATVAIANYNTGQFQEGFTFQANAQILETGNAIKAVRILKSGATPSTFNYVADLYIPIFTDAEADFTLTETGTFAVTKHTNCQDFALVIDVGSDSKIDIHADLSTTLAAGQVLQFAATGDFDATSETVLFSGNLKNDWVHPFGVDWLTIDTAQVSLELGGPEELEFTLDGSAALSFVTTGPVSLSMAIGGVDLAEDYISITGIPISQSLLKDVCKTIVDVTPAQLGSLLAHGTASIALSTYNAPQARQGFTFSANVNVQNDGSDLYRLVHYFSSNPTNVDFTMNLYADIFSQTPSASLSLSEQGALPLSKSVTAESLSIAISLGTSASLSASADLSVLFKHQTSPLNINVNAALTSSPSLSLSGNLAGQWVAPFGQKWLTLTSLSLSLALSPAATMNSLSMGGAGNFVFGSDTGSASVSFSVSDDFLDVTLTTTLTNQWTVGSMATSIIGSTPKFINGIQKEEDLTTTITLSTMSGVAIDVSGKISEDLATTVSKFAYWWSQDVTKVSFDISLTLPVFSSAPEDISLAITFSEEIEFTKHLWFESVIFNVAVPSSVGLDVKLKAQFTNNPVLYFDIGGSYKADNSIIMTGAMEGMWDNPFGIKGFDIGNVIVQFGFNPELCFLDGCISDFGLGCELDFTDKIIKLDGNVAAPDFADLFLFGSLETGQNMLSVLDVATEWNKINPATKVPTTSLAADWGVTSASFYFAPEDGTFGPITYLAGFGVSGNIVLLDMDVSLALNCSKVTGGCSFDFHTDFDLGVFTKMIEKELLQSNDTVNAVFSLSHVEVTNWSQQNTAMGIDPRWSIEIDVLGTKNHLDFTMPQYSFQQSFHTFFNTWLKHIF